MLQNLMAGLSDLMHLNNFIFMNIGMLVGIVFGAIPGLSGNLGIMLMLPMTFAMQPTSGILMLLAVYCGSQYGGSISSILIGTPGTGSAVATVFDGFPMAKQGKAKKALDMALIASTIGGLLSAVSLLFTAPFLSEVALKFAPPEYFALAIFGLSIIAGISGNSLPRGIFACLLGYVTAMVGIDTASGGARFVFGNIYLLKGLGLIPVMLGVFAIPLVFQSVLKREYEASYDNVKMTQGRGLTGQELKENTPCILKSSIIGIVVGAIPGAGAAIAAFIAYNEARRASKNPQNFGNGELSGVAAPEAANNGVTAASFIPLFTLGIPGSVAAAALIGAFTIHGMQVGPSLFKTQGPLLYAIMIGFFLLNIFMYLQGALLVKLFANIAKVPQIILLPIILLFCIAGAFSNANIVFDVYVMVAVGIIMYILRKFNVPYPPFILGMVLSPLVESNLKRALVMGDGSWTIFFTRPLSLVILIVTVVFTWFSIRTNRKNEQIIKETVRESKEKNAAKG
jgi:putative tricarboxylic transport membrane protein